MATQTTIARPAPFVEQLGKDLATQVVAQTAVPVVAPGTGGITQLAGESAGQFAARQKAAQQFDIRQQSLAGLAPQVAAQDALQKRAQTTALAGIGSFQPFIQNAQVAAAAATSPQIAQQFMSPYQQQVIDTTLNEFVFTADAVRNAGDGDVDKGAEVMYNMMKNLEAGGEVSEESQGLEGARKMFQTSQRLEEVL